MKTRNGFVANSSSSSFVMLGVFRDIEYDENDCATTDKIEGLDYLYVEYDEGSHVIGKIIHDEYRGIYGTLTFLELLDVINDISTKLYCDVEDIKLISGVRPC